MAQGFEYITNASDVTLDIGGHKAGDTPSASLIVQDFTFRSSNNSELRHGVGHNNPSGVTHGNATFEFEFTLEGEDAGLFKKLALKNDGKPRDVQVTGTGEETHWRIPHAWSTEREFSGSDDDPTEYSGTLICMKPQVTNA